jgi:uracil DNA glycosylase
MEMQRKRIGILYHFSPKWMGGVIYILNIVKVLNFLKDEDKPEIFLFYNSNLQRFVDELDYPYLHKIERPYPSVYSTFIKSFLFKKKLFLYDLI